MPEQHELILLGASTGFVGLGLQYFLPITQQIPLTRFHLIFFGFTIPIVYYNMKLLFWCLKRITEIIKEKEQKKGLFYEEK